MQVLWKIFQFYCAICQIFITFVGDKESINKPNRRKIGANAFLRKAEEARKH